MHRKNQAQGPLLTLTSGQSARPQASHQLPALSSDPDSQSLPSQGVRPRNDNREPRGTDMGAAGLGLPDPERQGLRGTISWKKM